MNDSNIKMVARCSDSVFFNSKSIFVEYIDIIRSPYFLLLYGLSKTSNPVRNSAIDVSRIYGLSEKDLTDFYYNRRNQNPLYDIAKPGVDYDKLDMSVDSCIAENADLTVYSPELNFVNVIRILMHTDSLLVKKIYIYYPYDNPNIKRDIATLYEFNRNIEFIYGDLSDVLKTIPEDSTYVFSDITKIEVLHDLGKLNMSSIVLPYEYGYNYEDPTDITGNLLIDLDAYRKDSVFKVDFFLASVDSGSLENSTEKQ